MHAEAVTLDRFQQLAADGTGIERRQEERLRNTDRVIAPRVDGWDSALSWMPPPCRSLPGSTRTPDE